MSTYSTIDEYFKAYDEEMKKPKKERNENIYPWCNFATKEQFDEYCAKMNITLLRYPENYQLAGYITFYRNDDPNRIMYTQFDQLHYNPNKLFNKDYNYMRKHNIQDKSKTKEELLEEQRMKYEDELRESMAKEGCTLTSKYTGAKKSVHYTFKEMDYSVIPARWKAGIRPHTVKCIRYTHEHIAQLFAKEDCQLISQYKNQKSKLTYLYKGKQFEVIWNDWKFYNSRPHLGRKKTYFSENK